MSQVAPIAGDSLRALLPHTDAMCLLERIEAWSGTDIECSTRSHRDLGNPLRRDDQLAALHLIEYAAQATALHGALLAEGRPQAGMLAAARDVQLHTARIDTLSGPLIVRATRGMARPDGLLYEFAVASDGAPLATGRLAIALRT